MRQSASHGDASMPQHDGLIRPFDFDDRRGVGYAVDERSCWLPCHHQFPDGSMHRSLAKMRPTNVRLLWDATRTIRMGTIGGEHGTKLARETTTESGDDIQRFGGLEPSSRAR
jgi:hypothetical protein